MFYRYKCDIFSPLRGIFLIIAEAQTALFRVKRVPFFRFSVQTVFHFPTERTHKQPKIPFAYFPKTRIEFGLFVAFVRLKIKHFFWDF